eukprot:12324333-Ditylum_brightwellii.AAC.1
MAEVLQNKRNVEIQRTFLEHVKPIFSKSLPDNGYESNTAKLVVEALQFKSTVIKKKLVPKGKVPVKCPVPGCPYVDFLLEAVFNAMPKCQGSNNLLNFNKDYMVWYKDE